MSSKQASEEMSISIYHHQRIVDELLEALGNMLDRHILYCGGPELPFAGHTDAKLFAQTSALIAKHRKGAEQ